MDNVQIALPCATQNEVDASDAAALMSAGIAVLCEGANMPCDSQAIELLHEHNVEFGPAKACNAGARHLPPLPSCAPGCPREAEQRAARRCGCPA